MWNFLEKYFEEILAGTLVMFMASDGIFPGSHALFV